MKKAAPLPPRSAAWLLRKIVHAEGRRSIVSDFQEIFEEIAEESGRRKAVAWYWSQTLNSFPKFMASHWNWRLAMLRNYITIAWRNIKKQKIYSMITMSGLVLGLAVFILFALMTDRISHFDGFHEKGERIYSVVQVLPGGADDEQHSAILPAPLAPALRDEFPEIEKAVRYHPSGRTIVRYEDKVFYESGLRFVDSDFLAVFSFDLISGDAATVLDRPNTVVLTRDAAVKYFGGENPLGKALTLDNKLDVIISGIIEDPPNNSSIRFDFLVSMDTAKAFYDWTDSWRVDKQAAFLLLTEGADPARLESRFSAVIDKYYTDPRDMPRRFYLHPLSQIYLNSVGIDALWPTANINYVAMWIVALLILIIACINYMNLSTARFIIRAKEVGMRKVIGARRSQLVKQFLGESTLMALISLPAAVLVYELLRPMFAAVIGDIFGISIKDSPQVLILALVVALLTGMIAGIYPAFYMSNFDPLQVFRGRLKSGKTGRRLRKVLVVLQFTFSIILIIITVISVNQSRYNLEVDLGFDRTGVIAVEMPGEMRDKSDVLKKSLEQNVGIRSISASAALPIEWNRTQMVMPEGMTENEALEMNVYAVDYGFTEMLEIEMVLGRSFSRDFTDDQSIIINQTAARQLQWEDPIGRRVVFGDRRGSVIGVARDFHFKSIILEGILPAVLYLEPGELGYLLVKASSIDRLPSLLDFTERQWKAIAPDLPFESITLEDAYHDFNAGDKTAELSGILGAMAIILSCLGLFGLSSYAVERRIKEIGIRKVLGASVSGIVRMLIKEFMKLVVIANFIAIPAAYFMMRSIMRFIYVYPTDIGAGVFVITALVSLLLAFLTVASQTMRSALASPADSLKYE